LSPTTGNAAAAPADRSAPATTDADNTRVNGRDRGGATLTPMDQGPSEADRKITREIRQALMNHSSLSFTAKNVKVITIDGRVTLRGPVKTEAERTAVEALARKVVGNGARVDSELELIQ
jgi:osmotically-inducible protein OsmY